jgi:uncharacterized membrane protein YjjP (DUF1212 family)
MMYDIFVNLIAAAIVTLIGLFFRHYKIMIVKRKNIR